MGWKIPEIKIRVPKARAPKAQAGRAMPKPRAVKPASGKIDGFSLTIFSSNKGPKGTKKIDVIAALIATGGNRSQAAKKLNIDHGTVSYHAKNIRHLSELELSQYAQQLGITAEEIKLVCADMGRAKNMTHTEIIKALLESRGNRNNAAQKLEISPGTVSYYAKQIRQLPVDELTACANKLGSTTDEIKRVSASLDLRKGTKHTDVISALIQTNGNRTEAAKKLRIHVSAVSRRAEYIRDMPDSELSQYAQQLGITAEEIKLVCADIGRAKNMTHVEIIKALLGSRGNRKGAAKKLGISPGAVSYYAKQIRRLPYADLQKYAAELKTTVKGIRRVCADLNSIKGITHIDVIKALLQTSGNRTEAANILGINISLVCKYAKDLRHLPAADLVNYAKELNKKPGKKITVSDIKDVVSRKQLRKIDFQRRLQVISLLIETQGNRTEAADKLGIYSGKVSEHAKNIRRLPDSRLQIYADELKVTVGEIRRVCADLNTRKNTTHIKLIRTLIAVNGNRVEAAKRLEIRNLTRHIQNIRRLSDAELSEYAKQLEITVDEIKLLCADLDSKKGTSDIEVITALFKTKGSRVQAAEKLRISPGTVGTYAKKIRRLSYAELSQYAQQLGTTVDEIRRACESPAETAKKKLFGK